MIRLPDTNELFRTINAVADGNGEAKNNTIDLVKFMVVSIKGWTRYEAASMWAATEWLKKNNISLYNVEWL